MCCSSTQRRRAFAVRHVFVLASSSGLRGHKRTYLNILELADHALFTREYTKCTAGSTFCFVVVVVLGKPLIKLASISADS
jgi:hypothetical protein